MAQTLHSEILQCLADGDMPTAKAKIERAIQLHYPDALVASWQALLNRMIQDETHDTHSIYPRQLATFTTNSCNEDVFEPDKRLQSDLFPAWKAALISATLDPPTEDEIGAEIERILAAIKQNASEILLPQFAGTKLFLADAAYTQTAYLEDNPDIEQAIASRRVRSWADHLLRHGIPEIIQGLRYSRYSLPPKPSKDCVILHLVDHFFNQDFAQTCAALRDRHPTFDPLFVVYDCSTAQFYRDDLAVDAGEILYAIARLDSPLLIRLDVGHLDESIYPWLAEISLDPDRVIYGRSYLVEAQAFSMNDALLDDILSGQLICSPCHLIAVFDQLHAYKSCKGFFCALAWELYRSGVAFHYTHQPWSLKGGQEQSYTWSPFYSPRDVQPLHVKPAPLAAWRSDQVKLWTKHLDQLGLGSRWQINQEFIAYPFSAADAVTILIPFDEQLDHLFDCVTSLFERQETVPIHVIAIGPSSSEQTTPLMIEKLQQTYPERLTFLPDHSSCNRSRLYNLAALTAKSKYLLLLHGDVLFFSDYAITNLLSHHLFFNAVTTGSLLYDQSGFIQHNGFALTPLKTLAVTSPTKGKKPGQILALNQRESAHARLYRTHECSAVSAACLLVATSDFAAVQGLDADLEDPCADVDFCLRLRQFFPGRPCMCVTDQRIVQQGSAAATDQAMTMDQRARHAKNREQLINKHPGQFIHADPFFGRILFSDDPASKQLNIHAAVEALPRIDLTTLYFHQSSILPERKIATIFVHYDLYGNLSENCKAYLQELSSYSTLYFVSSSELLVQDTAALSWLEQRCFQVIVRRNSGYDFGCWSHVIQQNYEQLCAYAGVLLVNDSVVGPLRSMRGVFEALTALDGDFAGLTACLTPAWHLQSYFTYYKQRLVRSLLFKQHWQDIRVLPSKQAVILHYEIAWSTLLTQLQFSGQALFDDFTHAENPTHHSWDALIEAGHPLIKRELLRENPLQRDLSRLPELLATLGKTLDLKDLTLRTNESTNRQH